MSRPAQAGGRAVSVLGSELLELLVAALADRVADEVIKRMPMPVAPAPAPPPAAPHSGPRLLRIGEVMHRTGLSKTTIYDRMRRHEFPQRVDLGNVVAWRDAEIEDWIRSRAGA